jgi:hypothetical protein
MCDKGYSCLDGEAVDLCPLLHCRKAFPVPPDALLIDILPDVQKMVLKGIFLFTRLICTGGRLHG